MKHIDISTNCYAHLVDNTVYIYIDNEFTEMLHVDNAENMEDPMPYIRNELELSSRASLYECILLV